METIHSDAMYATGTLSAFQRVHLGLNRGAHE
jgi:hypothetical protein